MKTKAVSLSGLLSLAALVPAVHGQIVVTASPMNSTLGQSTVVSLSLSTGSAYNLLGGNFTVSIGGVGANSGNTPSILSVAASAPGSDWASSVFAEDTGAPPSSFSKTYSFYLPSGSVPTSSAYNAVFARVTLDTAAFSSGSWNFTVSNVDFDDQVGGDVNPVVATGFNGTFSAVPEPEETMAVMAGVSLGLGWWIRRRRSKTPQPKG